MAYTSQIRVWWQDYFKQGYDERVLFLGREGVKATDFTFEAWRALEQALAATGYGVASIVSTYYPRYIGGTAQWSLHSFSGVAIDIDPYAAGNDFVKGTRWDFTHTKFTREQVEAVLRIRTNNGYRVWRWGGDFGDYMHWQLDCRPSDIATGIDWNTVPEGTQAPGEVTMGLKNGDEGIAVGELQEALLRWDKAALPEWGADEDFGDETEEWTRRFQASHDLIETGQLDVGTAFCLTPFQVDAATGGGDYQELSDELAAVEITVENLLTDLRNV